MWARLVAGLLLVVVAVACRADPDRSPELVVSAAVSLSDVLAEVASEYERRHGVRVALNLAGSDTLATQLVAGAPADLFISADVRQMERVRAGGVLAPEPPIELLANQLAVVTRSGLAQRVAHVADLRSPEVVRIALGDPESVPAGVYAREYLESVGLWEALQPKFVPTRDVRAALAAVAAGNADAGIVYRTDLVGADGVALAFFVPVADGPRIRYTVARLARSDQPAVQRLVSFLRGPTAARVFETAGFIVVDAPRWGRR